MSELVGRRELREPAKSKTREDVEKDFRDEADKVLKRNAWVDKQIALEENR